MESKIKDFAKLGQNSSIVNKERVYYSCTVIKYNDMGFRQERDIALTDQAIYNIKKTSVQRRIPFEKLEAITVSKMSSEFVLHIKSEHDYRYLSYEHRTPVIEMMLYILCKVKKICSVFKVYYVDKVNLDKVMTTHAKYKEKIFIRPPDSDSTLVDLDRFEEEEQKENERKTQLKTRTTMMFNKNKKENVELSITDFELIKVLGKGAFGKVILAQKLDSKKFYAIKILKKKDIIDQDQLEHTKAEKSILQHVNHPFVVGLEYAFQTPEKVYFVLEFMSGGELFQHLRTFKRFSEEQARFYAACITLGLGHLHNKNYIYRDLKLENLLLDEQGYAKITDFGLAKQISADQKATTFCGTPEYLAPEVVLCKGHNRPADWWSLGILIYEMMSGTPAFYSSNPQQMYKKIVKEDVVFKQNVSISDEGKDIILQLLQKDPANRLGSKNDSLDVMSHPWFKSIDMTKLLTRQLKAPFVPKTAGDEWIQNFDSEFTNEKPRDSHIEVTEEDLRSFAGQFNEMSYNKDTDPNAFKS